MTNEEQLREEWMRGHWQNPWRDLDPDENEAIADWWLRKLHQEELNWITEQIERGKGMRKEYQSIDFEDGGDSDYRWHRETLENARVVELNLAIFDFLAPLIARKKELEEIIGKDKRE